MLWQRIPYDDLLLHKNREIVFFCVSHLRYDTHNPLRLSVLGNGVNSTKKKIAAYYRRDLSLTPISKSGAALLHGRVKRHMKKKWVWILLTSEEILECITLYGFEGDHFLHCELKKLPLKALLLCLYHDWPSRDRVLTRSLHWTIFFRELVVVKLVSVESLWETWVLFYVSMQTQIFCS